MAKLSVYNIEGNQVGEIELNDAVFGVEVNENLMHKAVVAQLAASRQGTQSAKTRSDRKEQVMQDRVQQDLHSGQAVA